MFEKWKQTVRAFKDGKEIPIDFGETFFDSINIECPCGAKFRAGFGIILAEKFIEAHKSHNKEGK